MTDPQVIVNLGTGGSDLNGQNGSTSSADSNDARFLDWPGDNAGNYVYGSGVTNNGLRVPHEAAFNVTDLDFRIYLAADDWTPGTTRDIAAKWVTPVAWRFIITVSGLLQVTAYDGTNFRTYLSTASVPASDGEAIWLRLTLDSDDGSGNSVMKFYTGSDGVSWTQLGSDVTVAATITLATNTGDLSILGRSDGNTDPLAAKVYRFQFLDGIDGTTVLDVDTSVITSGSATSFTAVTGQTVTISRSTSGRKSVAVVSPVWLFGTDDYMEVADNALLDFGSSDSFTFTVVYRMTSFSAVQAIATKYFDRQTQSAGYGLRNGGSAEVQNTFIDDGTSAESDTFTRTQGTLYVASVVRDVDGATIKYYQNGTLNATDTDTTADVSNSSPLRVAQFGDGGESGDLEFFSMVVARRALTATEIAAINTYYQNKVA